MNDSAPSRDAVPHGRFLLLVGIAAALGAFFSVSVGWWIFVSATPGIAASAKLTSCNVIGIKVYGSIVSTAAGVARDDPSLSEVGEQAAAVAPGQNGFTVAHDIEDALAKANSDPAIKGVLIDVDSKGGGVVAGEEIALAIRRLDKPSVAVIHETGLSSGYLAAAAADAIFASANSAVGSIGATASFLDSSLKSQREGVTYQQLSSGPLKDMFATGKPLTSEERALVMRNVRTLHEHFVDLVALYRNKPIEHIMALADGSVMLGKQAQDSGLIDEIGGLPDAIQYLSGRIEAPVSLCW